MVVILVAFFKLEKLERRLQSVRQAGGLVRKCAEMCSSAWPTCSATIDSRLVAVERPVEAGRGLAFAELADAARAVVGELAPLARRAGTTGIGAAVDPRLLPVLLAVVAAWELAHSAAAVLALAIGVRLARVTVGARSAEASAVSRALRERHAPERIASEPTPARRSRHYRECAGRVVLRRERRWRSSLRERCRPRWRDSQQNSIVVGGAVRILVLPPDRGPGRARSAICASFVLSR